MAASALLSWPTVRLPVRMLRTIRHAFQPLRIRRHPYGSHAAARAAHGHHRDAQPRSPRRPPATSAAAIATVAARAISQGHDPSQAR